MDCFQKCGLQCREKFVRDATILFPVLHCAREITNRQMNISTPYNGLRSAFKAVVGTGVVTGVMFWCDVWAGAV